MFLMEQFFLYAINSCYDDWKNVFFLLPFYYHNACDHETCQNRDIPREASTQKSTCHHNHMILRGDVIKQVFYISTCRRLMDIKLYMVLTRCWVQEDAELRKEVRVYLFVLSVYISSISASGTCDKYGTYILCTFKLYALEIQL